MRQILQNLGSGETELADVPSPGPRAGALLVDATRSLVSLGTERMLVEFGRAGWIGKARQQPEKVRQVIDKIRVDGLFPTLDAVRSKLNQPVALGYCHVGVVDGNGGADAARFRVGDRVVSNAPHAERVVVPHNLCARVPDGVSDASAAFAVVGAIGLQGIRLLAPTLGEHMVVTGLGLIGLLAVQMLRANGCHVLGIDSDAGKCALAEGFGAHTVCLTEGTDSVAGAMDWSDGHGVDGVLVTASTQSSDPVRHAARMSRQRGRIVLVGVTGLELDRHDFYKKEISFQVSCSSGPGHYDPSYEEHGIDYPYGLVRWTEQRNIEAVLALMASGRIATAPLVTHRFTIADALRAYEVVATDRSALGIILEYPDLPADTALARTIPVASPSPSTSASASAPSTPDSGPVSLAIIGTGNYATRTLLPALKRHPHRLRSVVSARGVSGTHAAKTFGAELSSTDADAAIDDPEVGAVVITTRHNQHAGQVLRALAAGKHVFVEKPLCLTSEELRAISDAVASTTGRTRPILMIGFNRRFAPHVVTTRLLLAQTLGPKSFVMTVNAGAIPADHWTRDRTIGGGRIIGEGCHFVDLLRFLADSPIVEARVRYLGAPTGAPATGDTAVLTLAFADGSIGTVNYFANGPRSVPKERLEIFVSGRHIFLDNYRRLHASGFKGFGSTSSRFRQDKGHSACLGAFLTAIRTGAPSPIPFADIEEVSRVCIELTRG